MLLWLGYPFFRRVFIPAWAVDLVNDTYTVLKEFSLVTVTDHEELGIVIFASSHTHADRERWMYQWVAVRSLSLSPTPNPKGPVHFRDSCDQNPGLSYFRILYSLSLRCRQRGELPVKDRHQLQKDRLTRQSETPECNLGN